MSTNPNYTHQDKLFGTDLVVTPEGSFATRFVAGFTDFAVVSGPANLQQALINRLKGIAKGLNSRKGGSLPAHSSYGVGAFSLVSSPWNQARQQLQSQIITNFSSEFRIKPMLASDITFAWDNITRILDVSIQYVPINSQIPQNLIFPIYIQ